MSKVTVIEHLKACALAAKQFAGGLVGDLAQTVTEAMSELDNLKADKPGKVSATISKREWKSDSNVGYPKYYDIKDSGVSVNKRATVIIAPDSLETAKACGMCSVNETRAGNIRIRSANIPSNDINVEYWVDDGKEM